MNKQLKPELVGDDNPEWTDDMVKQSVRFSGLAKTLQTKLMGRPKLEATKERITIRVSPEVVGFFRTRGKGWQTRMNDALRDWIKAHP
jgi:uncharacterized protein (DUF4415 family)